MAWQLLATFVFILLTFCIVVACLAILCVKLVQNTTNPPITGVTGSALSALSPTLRNDGIGLFTNYEKITLTKDAFYQDLTLDHCHLYTNGWRLFVFGTLTLLNQTILECNGNDNGMGATGGSLGGGGNGARFAMSEAEPSPNALFLSNNNNLVVPLSKTYQGGGTNPGLVYHSPIKSTCDVLKALDPSSSPSTDYPWFSGGSGGDCANNVESNGGGGGGVILISAKQINCPAGHNCIIQCNGGNGNQNGSGGGGGGLILIDTISTNNSYPGLQFQVQGGKGGNDGNNNINNNNGNDGLIIFWKTSLGLSLSSSSLNKK